MAVVATGFFDGVHPGHRLVIDTLLAEAAARGEESVVVTFWPHPRAVLQNGADSLRYLTAREERVALLRSLGVDRVETVPFTKDFASLSCGQYLEMLCRDYGCSSLVLGYDTRFGSGQEGPEEIAAAARRLGLGVTIAPPVCSPDGAPISSSRIRSALEQGDVALAAALLGRPYRLHGVVVSGNHLGRTIGFPTANMKLYEPLMLIPSNGVYETRVYVGSAPGTVIPETSLRSPSHSVGPSRSKPRAAMPPESQSPERYLGLTNIGIRPTVGERNALTIETHILDFDQMIYGLDITVDFISRIRDERKFASLGDLRLQLEADARSIS